MDPMVLGQTLSEETLSEETLSEVRKLESLMRSLHGENTDKVLQYLAVVMKAEAKAKAKAKAKAEAKAKAKAEAKAKAKAETIRQDPIVVIDCILSYLGPAKPSSKNHV